MVIKMRPEATEDEKQDIINFLKDEGLKAHPSQSGGVTLIGITGPLENIDISDLRALDGVEDVVRLTAPYKLVSRHFRQEDTVITFENGVTIGGDKIVVMAGPGAVEGEEQIETAAMICKSMGAKILRGDAFISRTSPYSFQGLEKEGLKLLRQAADNNGMLVISEILDTHHIDDFLKYVDILLVGPRNMQNFELLKGMGNIEKPVMIKRGLSATIDEWLMAAEYVVTGGNHKVMLCERGIRTFEPKTRNTLDISAIPVLKELTHLPIVVDPSRAVGFRDKVIPLARAAAAAGADSIMVEVHPFPEKAQSDKAQQLYPDQFDQLMKETKAIAEAIGRKL
ncbi:MAG: 3-deoxy-7-phosphoheptulonate synthase [Candidatus Aminicenantes bacterium]|nr:3-deoxy-7-phosphoheptulonate synthase [Candidatus Aminicenantes bacterium]NIM77886.1 3-deoxy-7-phosphoheptulonate synthase [Candidatus Aminicenantes bacterium]NIN17199.1 3-deoxy-7-phosphoheptulonate synthase [Candidatus Aminicenantes bacterium]NIN41092.1 3-deoxy-7-phosphoheptulonate synthase [Candidatus Aminicenantes bacterium]NIN83897.1 3-deoxy-7-phosphoheptulonate synthase [Candidatus Aminicenantes bacterium]